MPTIPIINWEIDDQKEIAKQDENGKPLAVLAKLVRDKIAEKELKNPIITHKHDPNRLPTYGHSVPTHAYYISKITEGETPTPIYPIFKIALHDKGQLLGVSLIVVFKREDGLYYGIMPETDTFKERDTIFSTKKL